MINLHSGLRRMSSGRMDKGKDGYDLISGGDAQKNAVTGIVYTNSEQGRLMWP